MKFTSDTMTMIPLQTFPGRGSRRHRELLRSGHVAKGPVVAQFERGMAAYIGNARRRGGGSGTVALELALPCGRGARQQCDSPSYVCSAPWVGGTACRRTGTIVDINPTTYNLDPHKVRKARTSRTRAVIAPHLFGLPADLTTLQSLDIPLIEDCAQTLARWSRGRAVGTVGLPHGLLIFMPQITVHRGRGMVLERRGTPRTGPASFGEYDQAPSLNAGVQLQMTDLQAAVGVAKLNPVGRVS